jgi:hypothetical protein
MRAMEVLALRSLAESGRHATIYVRGATPAQARALATLLGEPARAREAVPGLRRLLDRVLGLPETIARVLYQAARIAWAFRGLRVDAARGHMDVVLFTYVEGPLQPDFDGYFGDLPDLLRERHPAARIAYVAYAYTPYRRHLEAMKIASRTPYLPLFAYLRTTDILRAVAAAIRALFPAPARLIASARETVAMRELLKEALRDDVARGGYLHNLLVHSSAVRMARALAPRCVIYPFENKSLEKALLLGVRSASVATKLIGYQHTSVTPRHLTLRFGPSEAAKTPLPDRIVTVGEVTRRYLESRGNYPRGIFATGCALRQTWDSPLPQSAMSREAPRIFLPLSSSVSELESAVRFMRGLKEALPGLELAVRAHPNFPLRLLPPALRDWVRGNAADFTGTRLRENLAWADLTAYVSSTVALESLIAGRPIVYLRIDPFEPDPLLENVRFRWEAADVQQFLSVLSSVASLSPDEFRARRDEAIACMREYLRPKSPQAAELFYP